MEGMRRHDEKMKAADILVESAKTQKIVVAG